ncbi:MAG TPA: lauroyl acyltransferase [Stellaceae bacterium]|nr:lauroyl acyltransferase [Stellaceae bacterium]
MSIFACLPVDAASSLGGYMARRVGPHIRVSRIAIRNIRASLPDNSEAENRRILDGMWDNIGRTVAEYPHLAAINARSAGRVQVVNGETLTELKSSARPSVIFGAHIANWEINASTGQLLLGASLLSVHRSANNPLVESMMRRFRGRRHSVAKGSAGGRDLIRHLRRGGSIAVLVDQKQNDGIAVPFFGRDAMTAPAIARLGYGFHCPIIPVRVERLRGARFRCTVLPPIEMARTGSPESDVLTTMTRVNAVIEDWVRANPEQWLWIHRRWPT